FISILSSSHTGDNDPGTLMATDHQKKVSMVVSTILEKYHFRKMQIDDSISSIIFDNYVNGFDPNKIYFLQEDIDQFQKYRYSMDDGLRSGDLGAAFEIYNVFQSRYKERNEYAIQLIQEDFDYSKDEMIVIDRENSAWASTSEELDLYWRKYVKNEKLTRILNDTEEDKVTENLTKRYENLLNWLVKFKSDDVFQIYMNSVSEAFDPHTNYFLPITYDNFMIGMSQSLEGIGASLQSDNEYTKVAEILPGGPAFKSKLIMKDDRIVGVAQGEDGEMVDIIGWRLDEAVKIIRGPKGSIVRLRILKGEDGPTAKPVEISLVRDKIKIEEAAPKEEVMTIYRGSKPYRIGVITIPSFYLDFEGYRRGDPDYKSTTKDVKKLLSKLENDSIDAILLDLRNNGGGSLAEAIELTGLFIPDGPVVQIKNTTGKVEVQKDEDDKLYYEGPLGVLINRFSASASEIFSGAIQDYRRGVVIGEQSYGKGTVQNLLDIDRFLPSWEEKPGQVKMTIAKFYRVTGSSTQNKGVTPDIELPSRFSAEDFGESALPSALPWDKINSSKFKTMNSIDDQIIRKLAREHEKRLKDDPYLRELINLNDDFKKMQELSELSLNLEERKNQQKELEQINADREELYGTLREGETNEVIFEESEVEDAYLREGLNVVADWLTFRIG
ncbi:MAG: carboxy terminal-processing peptidase, partial [Cyclobacteriaceae bacterium]